MKAMIHAVQQRASQFDRMILTAIVLLASIFPIELVPGSMPAPIQSATLSRAWPAMAPVDAYSLVSACQSATK